MNKIFSFNEFILNERLHINKELDEYSDKLYYELLKSNNKINIFENLPFKLNIKKLIININEDRGIFGGQLNIKKCKETNKGWIITIDLYGSISLATLKHELNHAFRLILQGKDNIIKRYNHIRSELLFKDFDTFDEFFQYIYLANEEEINSNIMEFHGFVKEFMVKSNLLEIDNTIFTNLYKSSRQSIIVNKLINFDINKVLFGLDDNAINKFLYLLEENKLELDKIQNSKFKNIKLFIKILRDSYKKNTSFDVYDNKIYKPKKDKKFYNKYINNQGEKLRRNILALYDNYTRK